MKASAGSAPLSITLTQTVQSQGFSPELFQDVGEIEQWMILVKAEDRNYFENIWKELGEAKAKFPTVRHYMMEVIKKAREAGIR